MTFRLAFGQISGRFGLVKSTHKINHQIRQPGIFLTSPTLAPLPGCLGFLGSLQPAWRRCLILLENTLKTEYFVSLTWWQIFYIIRKIFPVFLNPLFSRFVPTMPLQFGELSEGWPWESTFCSLTSGKTSHMNLMPLALCFGLVWLKDFWISSQNFI